MEKIILDGSGAIESSGVIYKSSVFESVADTVTVKAWGNAVGCVSMTVYAFKGDAKKFEVKTVSTEVQNGDFNLSYEFDPSSLAVYQDAERFQAEIIGNITKLDLSVTENSIEPSDEWRDNLNLLTKTEDGKPGVFVTQLSGEKTVVSRIPKKVLFMGNSLVFGMCGGLYGMCASAPDKDYFHYVSEHIKSFSPDCQFDKLYGSQLEHSENMEMFDEWFYKDGMVQFSNGTLTPAKDKFTPDLDLIFLQIGDNVNTEEKLENFRTSAFVFIERVKELCPKARIIFVHSWYGIVKTGSIIKAVCDKWEIERVDISCIHSYATEARTQKYYLRPDGSNAEVSERWVSHPGDLGMKKIAERIIDRLALED